LAINCLEVAAHAANCVIRTDLLELLAGRALVTGHVVYHADRQTVLENKMWTYLSSLLENDGQGIFRIDGSSGQNRPWVNYMDIQMKAASAAP
jgi:hypothetical protein